MSFLKKSLEKRIHELRKSIEAQTTELAAYEQVLALESGKPAGLSPAPAAIAAVVKKHTVAQKKSAAAPSAPVTAEFNGSRSDFVASVLKARGAAGVTPAEISAAFASRKIAVSKNLIYNVLSLMFQRKKVRKSDGRYYLAATLVPKKKSRISEEGMRHIIAATKKRWASKSAKTK